MAENTMSPGWSWTEAWSFFKNELAPYRGRLRIVARMSIAATVMMLCIMTFRLPGAALGAYYTLVISRDSTHATLDSALTILAAIALGLAEVLLGVMLFAGSPLMHFLWVVVSLFSMFFLISAATKYNFATLFGFLVTASIPIWDFPVSIDTALSNTLYAVLAVTAAAAITVLVELAFAAIHPGDLIQDGVEGRLRVVAGLLRDVREPSEAIRAKLVQYADIGTGNLRRLLTRSEGGEEDYARKAVLVALTGRLVDVCASLLASKIPVTEADQARFTLVAGRIDQIREFRVLSYRQRHEYTPLQPAGAGFLQLLESTVQLMHDSMAQPELMKDYIAKEEIPRTQFLKRDAFTNWVHLKFALRGTTAALICYLIYHLFDWRGINNAVATCMITALSTTGSSRQKQILRVAGAITGGLLLAIAAEVFLLPHMDSIAEFTLMFVAVTVFSSWFATSSPRLSYYGLQVAFAFYVVHLRTFAADTQLTPARDNVLGILLGLVVMWVVFDQLTPHNSMLEMKANLVRSIRLIAASMRERPAPLGTAHNGLAGRRIGESAISRKPRGRVRRPVPLSRTEYLKHIRANRDSINESFTNVRSSADAVLFEFDSNRAQALKLREDVRAWQPQIRSLFLLQITLTHMRMRDPQGSLPAEAERLQNTCAQLLETVAEMLERGTILSSGQEGSPEPVDGRLNEPSVAGSLAVNSLSIAQNLFGEVRGALV